MHSTGRLPTLRARRARRVVRQPGSGGRRRESGCRRRARATLPWSRARVRERRRRHRGGRERPHRSRRRRRRASRGSTRRAGNARDVVAYEFSQGPADRQRDRVNHRRPFFWRNPWTVHWTRVTGSGRGGADRLAARRRHHRDRSRRASPRRGSFPRGACESVCPVRLAASRARLALSLSPSRDERQPRRGARMTRPGELRSGAEIMCEALVRQGVEVIFGIPGGAIMPFYDALYGFGDQLRHVLCRHEQGAGHAAEGYARASGRVGVCVATSGPGATNLVTPIADAWMDSTPLVAITGQVSSALLGKDAFQETDITGITIPITKHNYLVSDVTELPRVFREAFHLANTGRRGPVLVDVPRDVQEAELDFSYPDSITLPGWKPPRRGHQRQIAAAAQAVAAAERPI